MTHRKMLTELTIRRSPGSLFAQAGVTPGCPSFVNTPVNLRAIFGDHFDFVCTAPLRCKSFSKLL